MNINPQISARVALQLIETATVKADDKSLEQVVAARLMLKGIAEGALVISTPAPPASPAVDAAVAAAVATAAANMEAAS